MELKPLQVTDGKDIYEFLQKIPKEEKGFMNGAYGKTYEEYLKWLEKSQKIAQGIDLEEWMVPQSIYWLYVDEKPVGMGKLRHSLTQGLLEQGGHGGYTIILQERGKGYGTILLKLLLEEAKSLSIKKFLVTVNNENTPSIKVALNNGGKIEKVNEQRHYIWIDL